jgi:hypothetical protein
MSVFVDVGIGNVIQMPRWTMRRTYPLTEITSADVLGMSHFFKVGRFGAVPDPAAMINLADLIQGSARGQ